MSEVDLMDGLEKRKKKLYEDTRALKVEVGHLKIEVAEVTSKLKNENSETVQKVFEKMEELNIKRESYYGQIFTAKNSMEFLKHHEEILECLDDEALR